MDEVKAYEPKIRNERTLSYTELRDLISSHFKLDSQTKASETEDEDIVLGQCDGPSSEWVDIKMETYLTFENPKYDFSILTSLLSGEGWGGERLGRGVG